MAEAALPIPTPSRRLSAPAAAKWLNRVHAQTTAEEALADVLVNEYPGGTALVSSFGADSAVLLHMVSRIAPATPVLFLETGMLFAETLRYSEDLAADLGLTDLRRIRPDPADLSADDPHGELHAESPDACCFLRKTLPLRRALEDFDAWITGRRRTQAATRAGIALFEPEQGTRRLKVNPLAGWTGSDIRAYREAHGLRPHPMVARDFPSIGCAPCTTAVAPGEDARAGRWRGRGKTECGIHFDGERWVRAPAPDGGAMASFP